MTILTIKYFLAGLLFLLLTPEVNAQSSRHFLKGLPVRDDNALTGSAFIKKIDDMPFQEREDAIIKEILSGNIPGFLREFVPVFYERTDKEGRVYKVEIHVLPDYLAIGSDDDFIRIPMGPIAAQKIADTFETSLPTKMLVDTIDSRVVARLDPFWFRPKGERNTYPIVFEDHSRIIDALYREAGLAPGMLVSGLKKDVIISDRLSDPRRTHHVTIYGWHYKDGTPIQPLTNVHIDIYVDYSHGIRLISSDVIVNGEIMDVEDILKSPDLYFLLSDEHKEMKITRYGSKGL